MIAKRKRVTFLSHGHRVSFLTRKRVVRKRARIRIPNGKERGAMKVWEGMSTVRRARWLSRVGVEPSVIIAASDWGHLLPSVKEKLMRSGSRR